MNEAGTRIKTDTVVIQSTPFCNLNCTYCYLPHRSIKKRISREVLSRIFQCIFSSSFVSDEISVLWHAGEPLALPTSFYREAFEIQRQWNTNAVHIINSFQTNATLITQEWCDFFKEYDVKVGVSLDGPEQLHDLHRVDRVGQGSFQRVMHGIGLLQRNAIQYAIIAVITKDSVYHPDDLWRFFTELSPVRLCFNPEEIEGVNTHTSLQTDKDIEQYKSFFKRILELSTQTQNPVIVREVEALIEHIASDSLLTRTQTNTPMRLVSFDWEGNISTFSPELLNMTSLTYGNFIFGNVFENTLEDVLLNQKFIEVDAQIQEGVAMCQETCEYFMFCGGGSPSNKLFENGTFCSTETIACRMRIKVSTDAILEHMEEEYNITPPPS
jgi:uncharacterized protein